MYIYTHIYIHIYIYYIYRRDLSEKCPWCFPPVGAPRVHRKPSAELGFTSQLEGLSPPSEYNVYNIISYHKIAHNKS